MTAIKEFNASTVLSIGSLIIVGVLSYGQLSTRVEANTIAIQEIKLSANEQDTRTRKLENSQSATDVTLDQIFQLLTSIDKRLERIENGGVKK